MRLCLALMMQNEADWIRLHVRHLLPVVDGLIAVDGGSTDDSMQVIESMGGLVFLRPFDYNFSGQANYLIQCAEAAGYDAILRLDPDETMFAEHVIRIRAILEAGDFHLLHIPRINFVGDRLHHSPLIDPHAQWRAWVLNRGIRYHAVKVHETPMLPSGLLTTVVPDVAIYHYGFVKPTSEREYGWQVYSALQSGQPVPAKPDHFEDDGSHFDRDPFTGSQPVDPFEVGIRAPLVGRLNMHLSVNLVGDRAIEYGFIENRIPLASSPECRALDVGNGGEWRLSLAAQKAGYQVTAIDYEATSAPPNVDMITGDLLTVDLPVYDLIMVCSTIEHVGLKGRYGVTEGDVDGDLKAMRRLVDALKPGGCLLLTLPVGVDRVHKPMHRVYGSRLFDLVVGLEVEYREWWAKLSGDWQQVTMTEAMHTPSVAVSRTDWQGSVYGLGLLVLRKENENDRRKEHQSITKEMA